MKIKNLLIVLMIVAIAITCIACNGGGSDTTTAPSDTTAATTAATTTKAQTTTKAPEQTSSPDTEESTTPEETTTVALDESKFEVALSIKKPESKVPAAAYSAWDGTVATSFAGGDGTEANPYLISNGAELAYLAQIVNTYDATSGVNPTAGLYYKLVADIYLNNLSDFSTWSVTNAPANVWTPIGLATVDSPDGVIHSFAGVFDGAGYTVFGLYVANTSYYGGLFGYLDNVTSPVTNLDTMAGEGGKELCATVVKDLTIAYSHVAFKKYGAQVSGFAKNGVLLSNCVADDTCTTVLIPTKAGTYDGGNGGILGRGEPAYLYRCISSAKSMVIPQLITADDGSQSWAWGYFHGGIVAVLAGVAEECANFGDVYATCAGGLGFGYMGASSIATTAINCLMMGTLYSGWDLVDTSVVEASKISTAGLFAARSAHVDCYPHAALTGCVSAGNFALDLETVNNKGRVCGAHPNICDVVDILYVDYNFDETLEIVTKWESSNQFYWSGVVSVTEAEFEALRAKYAN